MNWEKAQRGCLNLEEDGVKSFAAAIEAVIAAEAAICCGGVAAAQPPDASQRTYRRLIFVTRMLNQQ